MMISFATPILLFAAQLPAMPTPVAGRPIEGPKVMRPAPSAKEIASCLKTKQPDEVRRVRDGLKSGKFVVWTPKAFTTEAGPKNDISFHLFHLTMKFCVDRDQQTPREFVPALAKELKKAKLSAKFGVSYD